MITVTLVSPADGTEHSIEAQPGQSLMLAAVAVNATGIEGDCGGLLTCATCHVYVREPWLSQLPSMEADEDSMLEFAAAERRPNSRLGCQIELTTALNGLTVDLPESQY